MLESRANSLNPEGGQSNQLPYSNAILSEDLIACQLEYELLCLDTSIDSSLTEEIEGAASFIGISSSVGVVDIPNSDLKTRIFGEITTRDKQIELGSIWLRDGIDARPIEFPKSNIELSYLKLLRSPWWKKVFQLSVFLQIICTFIEVPVCTNFNSEDALLVAYSTPGAVLFLPSGQPTRLALVLLNLICVIIYFADLVCSFGINQAWYNMRTPFSKPWSTFRLFACLWIFAESLSFLGDSNSPRLYRSIYPFLFIARGKNLKLMMQGLLISGYYALPILKALLSVLILWGFFGYFVFQQFNTTLGRFDNPLEGIYTSLHCFTSRPYVLVTLNPFFGVSQVSAVFFVTLTLAADLLCISLIVATGTRQYKLFVESILKKRMQDRKKALKLVFFAFAAHTPTKLLSAQSWLELTSALHRRTFNGFIFPETAALIFRLEDKDNDGYVDEVAFFRLCGLLASRINVDVKDLAPLYQSYHSRPSTDVTSASSSEDSRDMSSRYSHLNRPRIASGDGDDHSMSQHRESALLDRESTNTPRAIDEEGFGPTSRDRLPNSSAGMQRSSADSNRSQRSEGNPRLSVINSTDSTVQWPSPNKAIPRTELDRPFASGSDAWEADSDLEEITGGADYRLSNFLLRISTAISNRLSSSTKAESTNKKSFTSSQSSNADISTNLNTQTNAQRTSGSSSIHPLRGLRRRLSNPRSKNGLCHSIIAACQSSLQAAQDIAQQAMRVTLVIAIPQWLQAVVGCRTSPKVTHLRSTPESHSSDDAAIRVNLMTGLYYVMHFLLLIQLCFVTKQGNIAVGWYNLGMFLEAYFWVHMVVAILGAGASAYLEQFENRFDAAVNVLSLIVVSIWGHNQNLSASSSHMTSFNPANTTAFYFMVTVQSFRLFHLFFLANDIRIFKDILPIMARAVFLLFSVIFFFAIFAHYFFCGILNDSPSAGLDDADDDSKGWLMFASMLNFNSNLQSLFTLFEMGILGNWSIVMDALVQSEQSDDLSIYFFFYIYRLTITLCILPILLSFIMQSFLASTQRRGAEMKKQQESLSLESAQPIAPNLTNGIQRNSSMVSSVSQASSKPRVSKVSTATGTGGFNSSMDSNSWQQMQSPLHNRSSSLSQGAQATESVDDVSVASESNFDEISLNSDARHRADRESFKVSSSNLGGATRHIANTLTSILAAAPGIFSVEMESAPSHPQPSNSFSADNAASDLQSTPASAMPLPIITGRSNKVSSNISLWMTSDSSLKTVALASVQSQSQRNSVAGGWHPSSHGAGQVMAEAEGDHSVMMERVRQLEERLAVLADELEAEREKNRHLSNSEA